MNVVSSGKVLAVCISETTGTAKRPVAQCRFLAGRGIEGDGHIDTIRPVSLLMREDIAAYNIVHDKRAEPGDFAENVVTEGLDLREAAIGDQFRIGEALLEVCQIGKEVLPQHYSFHGDRLLPTLGVFCRVLADGLAQSGTSIELLK
ncbi:MAG: MOSC domain-containing protein [Candidatus Riflebacteria bacterium HGW-Riflebacteria-2]|jgi:MOSC domain-containing protein YiiM|nr:MAG: MOSC domain-containing protein [Candidatus Riflebacteria bacterium HGW-Riflebacteria-2]